MQRQPPHLIALLINWACLAHLGLTAVVVTLTTTPAARTGATLETSSGNARWLRRRGGKNERYHAPCPDCGHAEGRARDALPSAASWCMGLKAHSFASSPAWTGVSTAAPSPLCWWSSWLEHQRDYRKRKKEKLSIHPGTKYEFWRTQICLDLPAAALGKAFLVTSTAQHVWKIRFTMAPTFGGSNANIYHKFHWMK